MLGLEDLTTRRLRRIRQRALELRMAARVQSIAAQMRDHPDERERVIAEFRERIASDEAMRLALSQAPLLMAAKQLGVALPANVATDGASAGTKTMSPVQEWELRRRVRSKRLAEVLSLRGLLLPVVSAIRSSSRFGAIPPPMENVPAD